MSHHGIPDNLQLVVPTEETEKVAKENQKRTRKRVLFAIVLVVVGFSIACGLTVYQIGHAMMKYQEQSISGFIEVMTSDSDEIERLLQGFMDTMAVADIETATEYLTYDAKIHFKPDMVEMIEQGNHLLFGDYENWEIVEISYQLGQDNPTSIVDIVFEIVYKDGSRAIFTAICEEWDDEWKIELIQLDHFIGLSASR